MTYTNREYLLFSSAYLPFGPERLKLLLSYFGSAEKLWYAEKSQLAKLGIQEKNLAGFIKFRESFNKESYLSRLKRLQVGYLTIFDEDYPRNLKGLNDNPIVLYYRGRMLDQDHNAVAIVGSRKITNYGREVTQKFAAELASLGVTIISGLALGIDAVAHSSALNTGGRSLAVLGTGVDTISPAANFHLGLEIIKSGALVSEFPLQYPIYKMNFARRNRIVSGLAKAVIVVEGEEKSGTLLTASAAADQGRQVFAVPGQITSPMSAAPHYLIKNGAKMATSIKDILDELDLQLKTNLDDLNKVLPPNSSEEILFKIIEHENVHLDELARITGLAINDISARLTIMELKGMIKNIGQGVYKKL